jgi:hypothetical protein
LGLGFCFFLFFQNLFQTFSNFLNF